MSEAAHRSKHRSVDAGDPLAPAAFDATPFVQMLERHRALPSSYQRVVGAVDAFQSLAAAWSAHVSSLTQSVSSLRDEREAVRQRLENEFAAEFDEVDRRFEKARGRAGFPLKTLLGAGLLAFFAGWIFLGGLNWGAAAAIWAGGVVALGVYYTRSRAMVRYWRARETVERVLSHKINEIAEIYRGRFAQLGASWRVACEGCSAALDHIGDEVGRLKTEDPAIIGRLDEMAGAAHTGLDRFHFRLGEINDTIALMTLDRASAEAIGAHADGPGRLRERLPTHWNPSYGRALLYSDAHPATEGFSSLIAALMARILVLNPPGKVNFTLFDPVGLGHNFSSFLKLSDKEFSKDLISGKAWSEREHMRARLKDLIAHIEMVTQKYLRDDFPNIDAYNAKAGEIAEAYRFLAVCDYPDRFDEDMARDLDRIVQNGPRCGVFSVVHVNGSVKAPYGVDVGTLRPFSVEVRLSGPGLARLALTEHGQGVAISPDKAPAPQVLTRIVEEHGKGSLEAAEVKVPYEKLFALANIDAAQNWRRSSVDGVEAPLGPMGAKKLQMLKLGVGLAHHGLIVGRPGSGKSNLLHVFITSIARLYSPEEVQFYLIDFKKGVEFKAYAEAQLPHARVIAVESEREFGMSVLQGLDEELKARGERFRQIGAVSLPEFRAKSREPLPRIILLVDEFQEFFSRDDRIAQEARALFDRLVRQGRAFGIHLVLGTQSLANSGLPVSTRDQMAIRIALQCSEADSRLILADDNTAARLLSRPGEAIFNDSAGQVEGNNLFQVALFSEEDRVRELTAIREVAVQQDWRGPPPVVFEGQEPADILSTPALQASNAHVQTGRIDLWLGEPTALRGPVAATLKRQPGRNLAVLTREEDQGVGVILACLAAVAAQRTPDGAAFHVLDFSSADASWADYPEAFAAAVPHQTEVIGRRDVRGVFTNLASEVERRVEAGANKNERTIVLAIIGLHRVRDLRLEGGSALNFGSERETPLGELLEMIMREGPEVGVHTLLWCDGVASLERALDRRGVNEIGLRASGALSGNDSHRFFDQDVAAQIDKPHRMIFFDEDRVGVFEQFRPYAANSAAFADRLKARTAREGQ